LVWNAGGGKYIATFSLITSAEYAGWLKSESINAKLMIKATGKNIRKVFFFIRSYLLSRWELSKKINL
jgi:hypothetical protein